jgi:SAM-dependent methyltransferase
MRQVEKATNRPRCAAGRRIVPVVTIAPSIRRGFDAAADRFDDDERGNPVLAHMRSRAWGRLRDAFARGGRLIELGSGTGIESSRLVAELGCRVALVDPSTELLVRAAARVRAAGQAGAAGERALLGAYGVPARDVGVLADEHGLGSFDGAFSSMGALNCEPSLVPVARGLATLLRPGSPVVLSIINRWCPAEVAWYALHGEWHEAARRWGGPVDAAAYPGGPKDVRTTYYSAVEVERAFARSFTVELVEAFPLLLPPPYLDFLVKRHAGAFAALAPWDAWLSRQRGFRALGDHVLVCLRRR